MLNIRPLEPREIGSGIVKQKFNAGGRDRLAGEVITGDELRTWKPQNLRNLMEIGKIACYPASVSVAAPPAQRQVVDPKVSHPADPEDISRIVVSKGFERFDVIEGRILARGVSKSEAHRIAGIPEAPAAARSSAVPTAKRRPSIRREPTAPDAPKREEPNGPVD